MPTTRNLHQRGPGMMRWGTDVILTLVAGAIALWYFFDDTSGASDRVPPTLLVLSVFVALAPLVVRRRYPLQVFGWVLLVGLVVGLWDKHAFPSAALLIALYTVAATRPRREALACASMVELVVAGAALRIGGWRQGWFDAIFLSGMVAAALGLGLYVATRRVYLAELQDRAARLERERDQQGALAAAAERARIAREIHDIVAHHLTVMVALSDGAIAASAASPERAIQVMRSVSSTGRRALADTRRVLGVLREHGNDVDRFDGESAEQPVPVVAELDVLVEQIRAAGLATALEIHGSATELSAGVQLTVYRLVQEALTNSLRHGGPGTRATVRLRYLPGELHVEIEDDGAGATASSPVGVGGGLVGMQERVHAYGGDVWSAPRKPVGWQVAARLPVDDPSDLDDPAAARLGGGR
jgi:signal transduction histidine kinase